MIRGKSKQAEVLAKMQLSPSSKRIKKFFYEEERMMMRRKSKQAEVLAKTQLSPSSKIFQERLFWKPKKLQQNDDETKEQVSRGVSQDVVVFLLKNISRQTFIRTQKQSNRMIMRRKIKQAKVLAKTQLSPSSKRIPKRLL